MSLECLPLNSSNKRKILLNKEKLEKNIDELESFLSLTKFGVDNSLSNKFLLSQEVKSNNGIEGYNDDMFLIYNVLYNHVDLSDKEKMQRIKNLYRGYEYILNKPAINKENLKKLYQLLSYNLLLDEDIENMGNYYRKKPVYIYYSKYVEKEPDRGIDEKYVEIYMNELLEYINSDNKFDLSTYYFIKSQIIHFQFVNIHPYFDINGRTSRTVSMWYLSNNNKNPFLIFNRAISLNKEKYYKIIKEARDFSNVTFFINYMLESVRTELEKEYIIDMINKSTGILSFVDYQTLYYILSMNSNLTAKDFMTFYNRYNDKKRCNDIYLTMLEPLLEKNVIVKVRNTNTYINDNEKNFIFKLNNNYFERDPQKIKKLDIF